MSTDSTTPEDAAKALRSFATKMRDLADAMEKADKMIYERLILGIPAEPPVWSIVTVDDELFVRARMGDWFIIGDGAPGPVSRSWREVCELGTPEVLESESVKALRGSDQVLREQTAKQAEWIKMMRKQKEGLAAKAERVEAERDRAWAALKQVREFASTCRDQYEASDYSEQIQLGQVADSLEGLLTLAGYAVQPPAGETS